MRVILSLMGILFLSLIALAQADEVKIETNLVNVGVIVKNKNGEFVKGLKKEAFQVFDNDEKQEISIFSNENEPISLGIVYDLHPTTTARTELILNSLRNFSKELTIKHDIFTILFSENGNLTTDFVPTPEQFNEFVIGKRPAQLNSLYDAVFAASKKIREKKNLKKMLLIISDGKDHSSHHKFSELAQLLKSFNVQIYSILLNNRNLWEYSDLTLNRRRIRLDNSFLDQTALKNLSKNSGGNAESPFVESEKVLKGLFKAMMADMQNQYTIGFYPKIEDGKRHKLKVTVNTESKQKLTVISRKDYQSLKK